MTSELLMRCNDLKCMAELTDQAIVTTCSHIFCLPCGQMHGMTQSDPRGRICAACRTVLLNEDDIVVTSLNPTEDYKTSILSGLSPAIIMECATRALAFYSYQAAQAVMYQEHLVESLKAKHAHRSEETEQAIFQANNDIEKLRSIIDSQQKTIQSFENKHLELSEAFKEKSRALAETQSKYHQLKTQALAAEVQYAASDDAERHVSATQASATRLGQFPRRLTAVTGQVPRTNSTRFPIAVAKDTIPLVGSQRSRLSQSRMGSEAGLGTNPVKQRTRLPVSTSRSMSNQSHYGIGSSHNAYGEGAYYEAIPQSTRPLHNSLAMGLSGPSKRGNTRSARADTHLPTARRY